MVQPCVTRSWLVVADVQRGRANLNLSEWSFYSGDMSRYRLKEACEEVKTGNMPPWYYTMAHAEAKLSATDVSLLCAPALATPAPVEEVTGINRRPTRSEAE